jgi:hypothetical protein
MGIPKRPRGAAMQVSRTGCPILTASIGSAGSISIVIERCRADTVEGNYEGARSASPGDVQLAVDSDE